MTHRQRSTLPSAIVGSAVARIDGSIVNVANGCAMFDARTKGCILPRRMLLAGLHLEAKLVRDLTGRLRYEYYFKAADTLERALVTDADSVALTIRERTAILDVLDDPPIGLEPLRDVL